MENGHLVQVPKNFELSGSKAGAEFTKIVDDINYLRKNVSVTYHIKVDLPRSGKKKSLKTKFEQTKSKHYNKFNVPLSKKNMKLSNYEILMKKLAEKDAPVQTHVNIRPMQLPTTVPDIIVATTKQQSSGKYKPIIHKYKTNYTKLVKPVRNDFITLETKEFRHH